MGIIKQISISGAFYFQHGIRNRDLLKRMLLHEYGFSAAFMIDDLLRWSRELSDEYRLRGSPKPNCWEVLGCTGLMENKPGRKCLCPALTAKELDSLHGGLHGGRACWAVDGTFCNEKPQGSHIEKQEDCGNCGFKVSVRTSEGSLFLETDMLISILNKE